VLSLGSVGAAVTVVPRTAISPSGPALPGYNCHPSCGSQRRKAAVEGSGQMHQRLSAAVMWPDGDHWLPATEVAQLLQVSQTDIAASSSISICGCKPVNIGRPPSQP
jgi:hypothetical protein